MTMRGKHQSEAMKAKVRAALLGKKRPGWKLSEGTKKRQGLAKKGIPKTEEHKDKIRKKLKGRKLPEETCLKMRASRKGENNPAWRGGISFSPYCPKFNEMFKEKVRAYYNYNCPICGKTQEQNGRRLHVHHVDYNKQTCCDGSKPRFIALCDSCHSKTNHNRDYWRGFFGSVKLYTP
jgi:hypothetical protein